MRKLYFSLSLFIGIIITSGQQVAWQRDIPSTTQDFLSGLSTTIDRQYLVSGSSIGTASPLTAGKATQNTGYDYHLVKLDQQGHPVWEKYYGGNKHDFLTATVSTQEGGFLLCGTSYSDAGGDKQSANFGGSDVWIIKISETGKEEWQLGMGSDKDEEARTVIQGDDLGYFVAGNVQNHVAGFGSKDAWVAKIDQSGKIKNQVLLGGTGLEEVEKIIPTRDGGALLAVYSRSGNSEMLVGDRNAKLKQYQTDIKKAAESNSLGIKASTTTKTNTTNPSATTNSNLSDSNAIDPVLNSKPKVTEQPTLMIESLYAKQSDNYGEGDYWIVKLDREGKVQWQKNYGGKEDDHIRTLAVSSEGYYIGGESRSSSSGNKLSSGKEGTDLWIISLNERGEELWQGTYSFGNRDVMMSMNGLWNADNTISKGMLIGGYTQSEGEQKKDDETFWMLYLDDKGKEVWRKYVEGKSRKTVERLVSANLNTDGTYILTGTSAEELGRENWKVLKLGSKELESLIEQQEIRIYPNPVADYAYVEIGLDFQEAEITLHDMTGRQIQTTKTKNKVTKINTAALPQGIYVVSARTENKIVNTKIVKK